jgi:hypothetical protein
LLDDSQGAKSQAAQGQQPVRAVVLTSV